MSDEPRFVPAVLAAGALGVNLYGLGWGLPNGDTTWAADAITPVAPLSILHRIAVEPWNSGWFWFKYPLGHVFVLGAAYAPSMVYWWLAGRLGTPASTYPYGFADPEAALTTLALVGRLLSAAMGAGCAVLAYLTVRALFGWRAALGAGVVTLFAYPVVYYAHTTNVEVPYLFWTALALYGAVRLLSGGGPRWYWVLGGAAAMAVSTKELIAGFVLALALTVLIVDCRRAPRKWWLPRGALGGLAVALGVLALANNVVGNPLGFVHRLQFLTHTLDPAVRARYAPHYFPIELGSSRGIGVELAQLGAIASAVVVSLGWPMILMALVGFAVAACLRPAATVALLVPALAFYLVGLRAMIALSLRYVLPLTLLGAMFAGVGLAWLAGAGRARGLGVVVAGAALVYTVIYGWDVNRMLAGDGRYAAEAWLARHVPADARVEVYQRPTYLPRFPAWLRVARVPFDEIGTGAFRRRRPDYVVLSSAGLGGVTVVYAEDWRAAEDASPDLMAARSVSGRTMRYVHRRNQKFLKALVAGRLPYRPVARFRVTPWIERPLIQSLDPEITIYARTTGAGPAPTQQAGSPGEAGLPRPSLPPGEGDAPLQEDPAQAQDRAGAAAAWDAGSSWRSQRPAPRPLEQAAIDVETRAGLGPSDTWETRNP